VFVLVRAVLAPDPRGHFADIFHLPNYVRTTRKQDGKAAMRFQGDSSEDELTSAARSLRSTNAKKRPFAMNGRFFD